MIADRGVLIAEWLETEPHASRALNAITLLDFETNPHSPIRSPQSL